MIQTEIRVALSYTKDDITAAICTSLPVSKNEIKDIKIIKKLKWLLNLHLEKYAKDNYINLNTLPRFI